MLDTTDVESLAESAAFLRDRMEKLRGEIGPKGATASEHLEKRYMALSAEYRRTITQLDAVERAQASATRSRPRHGAVRAAVRRVSTRGHRKRGLRTRLVAPHDAI